MTDTIRELTIDTTMRDLTTDEMDKVGGGTVTVPAGPKIIIIPAPPPNFPIDNGGPVSC
jgi:hypothetical protein